MMGLVGKKIGMTQLYAEDGTVHGVTVLHVGPNRVLQVKTEDGADGYNALQLAYGDQKASRKNKADLGHLAKTDSSPARYISEIRVTGTETGAYQPGKTSARATCSTRATWSTSSAPPRAAVSPAS